MRKLRHSVEWLTAQEMYFLRYVIKCIFITALKEVPLPIRGTLVPVYRYNCTGQTHRIYNCIVKELLFLIIIIIINFRGFNNNNKSTFVVQVVLAPVCIPVPCRKNYLGTYQ